MKRPYAVTFLMCVTIAAGAAGCAQQPVKKSTIQLDALAKQLGVSTEVLETALRAGYTTEIEGGKTRFCRHDELTGSMIGRLECEDADHLQADLEARQRSVDDLRRQVSQTAIQPRPGGSVQSP